MEWLVMGALVLIGALLIKFITENSARKEEAESYRKTSSKKLRLEPNANLPLSDTPLVNYRANRFILSKTEQAFYKALRQGLGDQFLVLIKVRVCDVLRPETGIAKSVWQIAFNRISSKHFNFVLCSPNQYEIIAAIELDDSINKQPARRSRDKFLNEACESANFPLIRITARQIYSAQEIKAAVLSALRDYRVNKAA